MKRRKRSMCCVILPNRNYLGTGYRKHVKCCGAITIIAL